MNPEIPNGPAWVVALSLLLAAGVAVVKVVAGIRKNGHLPPELAALVEGLRSQLQNQTSALQAVTLTLTALTERIAHFPTREDLAATAEKNRHDYRNSLAVQALEIRNDIRELRAEVREHT